MKKLKKIITMFLSTFGFCVLLYTTGIQFINPGNFSIKFVWALALMLAINNTCGLLIFKTGVSKKSLWIRRFIVIGIMCIATPGSVILCGVINFNVFTWFEYVTVTAVSIIVLSIITYLIADRLECKAIERINKKLSENER